MDAKTQKRRQTEKLTRTDWVKLTVEDQIMETATLIFKSREGLILTMRVTQVNLQHSKGTLKVLKKFTREDDNDTRILGLQGKNYGFCNAYHLTSGSTDTNKGGEYLTHVGK